MKLLIALIVALSLLSGGYLLLKQNQTGTIPEALTGAEQASKKIPSGNKLDLSGQRLTKVPEYIFSQTSLEELNLSNNLLTGAIPAEIRKLKNLKVLDLSDNQMTGVPAEVGQLQNLQILDLSNNQLTGLPYELGNLKSLKTLNLSGNSYSEADLNIILKSLPANVNVIK